jgi:hypothetical protein
MTSSSDFYYYIQIPDTSFNLDIIRLIDSYEDNKEKAKKVNAKMTPWHIEDRQEVQILKKYILEFAKYATKHKFDRDYDFRFHSMWGVKYESGDFVENHDHWPAIWSACYYLNPPDDCSGLYFTDLKEELKIKNGMLVLFPGWVSHEVKKQKFDGKRYVIASNLVL